MNEFERFQSRGRWIFHLLVFGLLLWLSRQYFTLPRPYGMLDYAILPFHEAGHFVFGVLGEFLGVAGGTIVQVLMPAGFAVYFGLVRKDTFAALVALFWMFQTSVNVSVYMADARFMHLPLFGGSDDVTHDWNYLFGHLHLLHQSESIAAVVRTGARLGMAGSLLAMAGWLWVHRPGQSAPPELV